MTILPALLVLSAIGRPAATLTAAQRLRADRLISLFENGTIEIQYGYVEKLGDGRGYTVGRGFTTGTGDAREVIERYDALLAARGRRDRLLSRYLPALKRAESAEADELSGLGGFPEAWKKAATDPLFRRAQDDINERLNVEPAMQLARKRGLRLPLTLAALYDAAVLHGTDDDADSLPSLLARADKEVKTPPAAAEQEAAYMRVFLAVRRDDLMHARDEKTRRVWRESTQGRVETFLELYKTHNYDFEGPLRVDQGLFHGVIP